MGKITAVYLGWIEGAKMKPMQLGPWSTFNEASTKVKGYIVRQRAKNSDRNGYWEDVTNWLWLDGDSGPWLTVWEGEDKWGNPAYRNAGITKIRISVPSHSFKLTEPIEIVEAELGG